MMVLQLCEPYSNLVAIGSKQEQLESDTFQFLVEGGLFVHSISYMYHLTDKWILYKYPSDFSSVLQGLFVHLPLFHRDVVGYFGLSFLEGIETA